MLSLHLTWSRAQPTQVGQIKMENNTSDFVCVGFDIRDRSSGGPFTADATEWPRHGIYDEAKRNLHLSDNIFQLMHVGSHQELEDLFALVKATKDASLIALELPRAVVDIYIERYGFTPPDFQYFTEAWEVLGFDVCDANGFFSILHMEVLENNSSKLFSIDSLMDALTLAQTANFLVPPHSPFVVTKLACMIA